MTLAKYKQVFSDIITIAGDAEGFGLCNDTITDEDIEKCKYIAAMLETLKDVPERRVNWIFNMKNIVFDSDEIYDSLDD